MYVSTMRKALALLMVGLGCGLASSRGAEPGQGDEPDDQQILRRDNTAFALELYAHLAKSEGNLCFSPVGTSSALSMPYAGARGQTALQMAKTLHFSLSADRLLPAFAAVVQDGATDRPRAEEYPGLSDGQRKDPRVIKLVQDLIALESKATTRPFSTANGLWVQKGCQFQADFLRLTSKHHGAGIREVDFVNARNQAGQTINQWVEKQTEGRIKGAVKPDDLDADTRLLLTTAIHFKATWLLPFHKRSTEKAAFFKAPDDKVQVPMMQHGKERFRYLDGGSFQALELPYDDHNPPKEVALEIALRRHELKLPRTGGRYSMVLFLPKQVDGLAAFEKTLTAQNLAVWLGRLATTDVYVSLPRFKLAAEYRLHESLAAMGMTSAFEPKEADFSGITGKRDLFLAAMVHQVSIDVNEEGTEAGVMIAQYFRLLSEDFSEPPKFRADHPFVFLIRDNRSGGVLFLGRVLDPSADVPKREQ
jgi:serpin B